MPNERGLDSTIRSCVRRSAMRKCLMGLGGVPPSKTGSFSALQHGTVGRLTFSSRLSLCQVTLGDFGKATTAVVPSHPLRGWALAPEVRFFRSGTVLV